VSNVTHEIRTPLVGVFGMLELVLDTPLSAEQRRNLMTIESCAKGLLYILNGILDYSKIEAKKLEVEQSPFEYVFQPLCRTAHT
jgi:signal transduction histidine kinase